MVRENHYSNIVSIKNTDLEDFKQRINEETAWEDFKHHKEDNEKKEEETIIICCDNPQIVIGDDKVCINCGIIQERHIDPGKEWNIYEDSTVNPIRCGKVVDPLQPHYSMATIVPSNLERYAYGQIPYEERALKKIFDEIEKRCNKYLSKTTLTSAKYIFKEVREKGTGQNLCSVGQCNCIKAKIPCTTKEITCVTKYLYEDDDEQLELFTPSVVNIKTGIRRGIPLRSIVACCVERAIKRTNGNILSDKDLCRIFQTNTRHLMQQREYVTKILDRKNIELDPQNMVDQMCVKLSLDHKYIQDVHKLTKFIKDNKFLTSKAELSKIAGCIYYTAVYHNCDDRLTCKKVGDVCSVSKITVQKIYDEIDDIITKSFAKVNAVNDNTTKYSSST